MTTGEPTPGHRSPALIERRIRKIANARSITVGLAFTFLSLSLVGGVVIWLVDRDSFPSLGLAFWWALQTVTTVGYGDVVPAGAFGKVIGSIEMVIGVSFISFLTAGVTSAVVRREQRVAEQSQREQQARDLQKLAAALTEIRSAIASLDRRLDQLG